MGIVEVGFWSSWDTCTFTAKSHPHSCKGHPLGFLAPFRHSLPSSTMLSLHGSEHAYNMAAKHEKAPDQHNFKLAPASIIFLSALVALCLFFCTFQFWQWKSRAFLFQRRSLCLSTVLTTSSTSLEKIVKSSLLRQKRTSGGFRLLHTTCLFRSQSITLGPSVIQLACPRISTTWPRCMFCFFERTQEY